MKQPILSGAVMTLLATAGICQNARPEGHWQGKIQIPQHELGITVDLAPNAKGGWIGSMSVQGSSATDVPLSTVSVEGSHVQFTAGLPDQSTFAGTLSTDGAGIAGTASSAAGEAPFQLTRAGEAAVKLPPPSTPLPKQFEGSWQGTVTRDGKARRVSLKLAPSADGTATGKLIAVDSGNLEIPLTTVAITNQEIRLEVRSVGGSYRGTLNASGEIVGEWAEATQRMALTFQKAAQ